MFSEHNQLLLIVFLCGIVTGMYTFLCMKEECPQNSLGWCAMSYAYITKKKSGNELEMWNGCENNDDPSWSTNNM